MAQVGMVGLAVMGSNLALNLESKGYAVAAYSISREETQKFMDLYGEGRKLEPAFSLEELIEKIEKPRVIIMMIRAGSPVDEMIDKFIPLLEEGDVLIDGGNSNFHETRRRCAKMAEHGLMFVGMGVSGGEEGALHGPSLMPGGDPKAWENAGHLLQAIAAKAADGQPCCNYVGPDGAGHFTKTVHNGIEYGDMQLICEAYHMLRDASGLNYDQMSDVFAGWNQGMLGCYLNSITTDILKFKEDGAPLVPRILDVAGQKGTGKWTVIEALNVGVPSTVVGEALFARFMSGHKERRVAASKVFDGPAAEALPENFTETMGKALLAAKIILYSQGMTVLQEASKEYNWNLSLSRIARLWRGGCIIRSNMLNDIAAAFEAEDAPEALMLAPKFAAVLNENIASLREVVVTGVKLGIPLPAMSSALAYFDSVRCAKLPAGLLQAQRDYFGAHGYVLEDKQADGFRHTNWTGRGGDISSGIYNN
ncbi:MAG: decarboxylating NADP(+)-dependent phosphogluconate dehydrogenase [Christensenellaceae bacterium]|nr:decarboxylating NADP(+)-dependent phosphogluconate dehydrogenase [Christensenellaceae bacterium]